MSFIPFSAKTVTYAGMISIPIARLISTYDHPFSTWTFDKRCFFPQFCATTSGADSDLTGFTVDHFWEGGWDRYTGGVGGTFGFGGANTLPQWESEQILGIKTRKLYQPGGTVQNGTAYDWLKYSAPQGHGWTKGGAIQGVNFANNLTGGDTPGYQSVMNFVSQFGITLSYAAHASTQVSFEFYIPRNTLGIPDVTMSLPNIFTGAAGRSIGPGIPLNPTGNLLVPMTFCLWSDSVANFSGIVETNFLTGGMFATLQGFQPTWDNATVNAALSPASGFSGSNVSVVGFFTFVNSSITIGGQTLARYFVLTDPTVSNYWIINLLPQDVYSYNAWINSVGSLQSAMISPSGTFWYQSSSTGLPGGPESVHANVKDFNLGLQMPIFPPVPLPWQEINQEPYI